ncbi:hypothetical protein [Streptomyces platensis]|uniref:hypothetical protein n=1 Tax=Streptomyces platensis TaxID=58346 RepID=UPI003332D77A
MGEPAVDRRSPVATAVTQVAGGVVPGQALHGPVESAGRGEPGDLGGAAGDLLLFLEALLLGFLAAPVGGEFLLDHRVGIRVAGRRSWRAAARCAATLRGPLYGRRRRLLLR